MRLRRSARLVASLLLGMLAPGRRSCAVKSMLTELRQRIREVRQGPYGLLYLLTDEDAGALLRIEPAA